MPERLGKLTIRLEYEKGKTEVTIFSTSAKTLEILSKEAGHLAQILEEKNRNSYCYLHTGTD